MFPSHHLNLHAKYSHMTNMPRGRTSPGLPLTTGKPFTVTKSLNITIFPLARNAAVAGNMTARTTFTSLAKIIRNAVADIPCDKISRSCLRHFQFQICFVSGIPKLLLSDYRIDLGDVFELWSYHYGNLGLVTYFGVSQYLTVRWHDYRIPTYLIRALWVRATYLFTNSVIRSCDSLDWSIQTCY